MVMAKGGLWVDFWRTGRLCFVFVWSSSGVPKAHFHRVYAAYGGVFIVMSVVWGWLVDGVTPDRYDIIGTIIAVIGVVIIFYIPRKGESVWSKS
jgi:drug/metabolite transporter superfamily protein YnfA